MPTYTAYKKLEKPDLTELYDINSANRNNDIIDSELQKIENNMDLLALDLAAITDNKVDKVPGKGLSTNDFTDEDKNKLDGITLGTIVTDDPTTTFEEAGERENIVSGEKISVMFGKIRKWLSDMKSAAFCSVADNLVTTVSGSVLDARQGKILDERITGLYSEIADSAWTGTTPDGVEYTLSMFLNELFLLYHPSAKSLITTVSEWTKSVWNRPDAGAGYTSNTLFTISGGRLNLSCKSNAGYANHWSAIQITSAAIDLTGYKKLVITASEALWGNGTSYYGSNVSIILKNKADGKETTLWTDTAQDYTDAKQASINKEFDVSKYIGKYLLIIALYANNRSASSISFSQIELTA